MTKKISILLLCLMSTIGLWALDNVPYVDADGTTKYADNVTEITDTTTTLSAGWYVVNGTDVHTASLRCTGAAHLILADGAKLTATGQTARAGIEVSSLYPDAAITIYGQSAQTGQLIATGASGCAGIGGGSYEGRNNGQNITINGGVITASSPRSGAGIGGGRLGFGSNIHINGGSVTATSNDPYYSAIGGLSSQTSFNIYVHDTLVVKADTQNPPAAIISHTISTDIATALSGKQYAKIYSAGPLTVTLNKQVGTGGSNKVTATYGKAMPTITVPTRTGYTFSGYYAEADGQGTQYYHADGTSAHVWDTTEGKTLYAYWTVNQYTVTLDMQGGSDGTASVTATYDAAMPAITVPTRTSYTFHGYFTEANGRGTQYYHADGTSARVWDIANNTTLYAYWQLAVTYIDEDGIAQIANTPTIITNTTTTLNAGWYVVLDADVQTRSLTCNGAVKIILVDSAKLSANGDSGRHGIDMHPGICVSGDGNSLTIYGQENQTGKLITTGGEDCAGIGGGSGEIANGITINGGDITAIGGRYAAGIGGGSYYGKGTNITINRGTVHATGTNGAGIGGGNWGEGSYITINGGTVTATGNNGGAGIGGGDSGSASTITINGGVITANGGDHAAAIGGGWGGSATGIYVDASLLLKADHTNPPTTVIAHTSTEDVAAALAGKQYAFVRKATQGIVVTLDKQEGIGGDDQATVTEGAVMPTIAIPTLEGCRFRGYYAETDGRGTQYYHADGTSANLWDRTENTTIYAYWHKPVPYVDADGTTKHVSTYEFITNESTTLTAGWYVVRGEVSTGTLVCEGEVHLVLTDGATLTATGDTYNAGIRVSGEDNSLTVYGQEGQSGQIIAIGGYDAAGIGGEFLNSASHITIHGGVITATGGEYGAGIGSGYASSEQSHDIYVADRLYIKADNTNPPLRGLAHQSIEDDMASSLANKRYVTISTDPYLYHIPYISNGTEQYADNVTELTAETTTLTDGWYIVLDNIETTNLTCEGDVRIILSDDATLTATGAQGQSAIRAFGNSDKLTFYGQTAHTGKLFVNGGEGADGISVPHVYVAEAFYIKADNNRTPYTILPHTSIEDDMAEALIGKRYASITDSRYLQNIPYIDEDNQLNHADNVLGISSETNTLTAGWYLVQGHVETGTLTCEGDVYIILADGATLTARGTQGKPGIRVSSTDETPSFLAIYGQMGQTGKLIATGDTGAAGIGGAVAERGTNIRIFGGNIVAVGGGSAAAIGNGVGATDPAEYIYFIPYFTEVKAGSDSESAESIVIRDYYQDMAETFADKQYVEFTYYCYHDHVAYIDANGALQQADHVKQISYSTTTLTTGWYVVTHDFTFYGSMTCQGDVHLILADGATLSVLYGGYEAAIHVEGENSLTIYDQSGQSGRLIVQQAGPAAGIGGNVSSAGANITINGGIVISVGEPGADAIGKGAYCEEGLTSSNIKVAAACTIWAGTSMGNLTPVEHTDTEDIASKLAGKSIVYINFDPYLHHVPYVNAEGELQTVENAIKIIPGHTLTEGWYVVAEAEENLTGSLICHGDVHLILADGAKLKVTSTLGDYAGINLSGEDNSLTIYGQTNQSGQLIATGGVYGAGIGGGDNGSASYITINGGIITANGGKYGAGIGGGWGGSASYITINGGTITANGGENGAGIGGGFMGSASYITINGGTITAKGGEDGAGIGNGFSTDNRASDIHVADGLYVMADNTNPPTTLIDHSIEDDLAESLAEKQYAYISNSPYRQHVPYLDAEGEIQYANDVQIITTETTILTAGWYLAAGNVNTGTLTCEGEVHIIVADGSMLTVTGENGQSAIRESGEEATLTIYGQSELSGMLIAIGDGVSGISNTLDYTVVGFEEKTDGNTTTITKNPRLNHVPYRDMWGKLAYADDVRLITATTTTLNDAWYMITGDVETGTLTCVGDAGIILADGATLTATGTDGQPGIRVSGEDNTLSVYGQMQLSGTLIANGGNGAAGIGGGTGEIGNNIFLGAGHILANGGTGADGIGCGAGATGTAEEIIASRLYLEMRAGNNLEHMQTISLTGIACGDIGRDISELVSSKQYIHIQCPDYVYDIPYVDERGNQYIEPYALKITSETTTLQNNSYVVQGNVETGSLTCEGYVYIILTDGATLTATGEYGQPGIRISGDLEHEESGVMILAQEQQTGTLIATGGYHAAGIGGGENETAYYIYIYGGTIQAVGGEGAAGIGSGYNGTCEGVYIDYGTITATGGENAPAIGGNIVSGIRVDEYLTLLADNHQEPTTIIAHDYSNIAASVADKRYAKLIPGYLRYTTVGNYGTICLSYNVPDLTDAGAVFYQVAGVTRTNDVISAITLEEVSQLQAGYSYVYQADGDHIFLNYGHEYAYSGVDRSHGMVGKLSMETERFAGGEGIYALGSDNMLHPVPEGVTVNFVQNKAYFNLTDVPDATEAAAPGRISMSIYGQQVSTGVENENEDENEDSVCKVLRDGVLYIIKNGHVYTAQGMLVE